MNIFLIIIAVVIALIALVLIFAATNKNEVVIEREIVINKPRQEVFNYIKHLRNQDYYNKWVMMDPNSKKTCTGTDGTIGFVSAWDSDNKQVGKGEQEIKNIKEGERVDIEIRFIKPMENTANTYITTESLSGNQTKVRWVFSGNRSYMMKVMYIVLNMKKMLGSAFQESITNLKGVLEK